MLEKAMEMLIGKYGPIVEDIFFYCKIGHFSENDVGLSIFLNIFAIVFWVTIRFGKLWRGKKKNAVRLVRSSLAIGAVVGGIIGIVFIVDVYQMNDFAAKHPYALKTIKMTCSDPNMKSCINDIIAHANDPQSQLINIPTILITISALVLVGLIYFSIPIVILGYLISYIIYVKEDD